MSDDYPTERTDAASAAAASSGSDATVATESPAPEAMVSTDPVADLQRERDDYYDRWMRKAAEFDNYRKRVERERREQTDQAVVDLLRELLLVVDDFDLALKVEAGDEAA